MSDHTLTIITTVYNVEKYLKHFFENLQQQTFSDYELLIVDDGSSDNTLAVCREHSVQDDRIRIFSVEHIGISAARNLALESVTTPFAASLDADDSFDKDYLKHLVDAQKKYDADLVISNVIYCGKNGTELERFKFRKEGFFTKEDFRWLFAALLDEDRLNYLYGKLYRTELLHGIRVEEDVRQGSDTMINCQYIMKIDNLAVIENYDYYYDMTNSTSVTSYVGKDVFTRLCRINSFVYDMMEQNGYVDDEMVRVIDGRVLLGGRRAAYKIIVSKEKRRSKKQRVSDIFSSEEYCQPYLRQKERNNLQSYKREVIEPGKEMDFYLYTERRIKEEKRRERIQKRIAKLIELLPDRFIAFERGLRVKLGLRKPDNT